MNAEHYAFIWASWSEPKSMGMRSIATYTFAKFQENTSDIHVQYTIGTMNIQYQKNTFLSRHNWI